MGTVTQRQLSNGTLKFRAEIRINRQGLPSYKESKTFSSKKVAKNWLTKREAEIEQNPAILLNKNAHVNEYTLVQAIDKYMDDVGGAYSKVKMAGLKRIKKFPIAKCKLMNITSDHIAGHVKLRRNGCDTLGYLPNKPSSIQTELLNIRSVLVHASVMWNVPVDLNTFDRVSAQMRKTRQLVIGDSRDRLPTQKELLKLTKFFVEKWNKRERGNSYPMHLIMWFAIFSCRRESEICRIKLSDYDTHNESWLVRDLKSPKGSKGNNKEFNVLEPCKKIIDLALRPEYRNRMLRLGYSEEYLFPVSLRTVASEFRDACKILGIEDLKFHDLRHEACTRLAEQGFTIPQLQQVSLHESWKCLQIYVSVKKRKDVLKVNDVLRLIDEA
ncbi:tyrosine-type recombinase/integrase [Acinetobacter sp. ESBL14]|uniref:tyrosine-type recombinase/integrase n=1 Tax=Acinetobacter sp. ESBL14 TaxID=3077329 RepID=UPI002FC6E4D2